MLFFPLQLAGIQILRPVLTLLFEVQQIPLFYISLTFLGKMIVHVHK